MVNLVNPLVCVSCITYNHRTFIKDAMNGFCSQITSFPFVCVIVDDASTDGERDIIKQYLRDSFNPQTTDNEEVGSSADYFFFWGQHRVNKNCFFAVYLLNYNHYQIGKSKLFYVNKWAKLSKYVAMCEGDDYWISPDKLQKQVSFLDNNICYSMTCNRSFLYSVKKQKIIGENYCYSRSRVVSIKDVIYRRGLFISTCTIVYRKSVDDNMPDYWLKSEVGDYPLQIACALKGKVWYFDEPMAVYRIDNPNSWIGNKRWFDGGADPNMLKIIRSSIDMFNGFAKDYPQYKRLFVNKIAEEINRYVPSRTHSRQVIESYLNNFQDEIYKYSFCWKFDLMVRKCRVPFIRGGYQRLFLRRFLHHNKFYKSFK